MDYVEGVARWLRHAVDAQEWLAPIRPFVAMAPDWALMAAPTMTALVVVWLFWPRAKGKRTAPARRSRGDSPVARPNPTSASPQATSSLDDADARTIRVFVSSTFLDMQRERDILVREVFPALRARFRARGVEVQEVDLRWGITKEQSENGETLPTLLAEIDRCRPYFIGLLGDRYGWVPPKDAITEGLRENYPSLVNASGCSITEIEVVHGVLRDPATAAHALFFERNATWDWKATLNKDDRAAVAAEASRDRAKLAALKTSIRETASRFDSYGSPEELGQAVLQILGAMLQERFPGRAAPDAFTETKRLHAAYARERRRFHIGAGSHTAALTQWMGNNEAPPMLITGDSGGGKSTLIANWVHGWRSAHPNDIVFEHYLGASPDSGDPTSLLRRLWEHLNRETAEIVDLPGGGTPLIELADALAQRLLQATAAVERRGGRILITLDGLDKLSSEQNLRWLPSMPRLKVLASSLDCDAKAAALAAGWIGLEVNPLSDPERKQFIERTLEGWGRKITPAQAAKVLAHPLAGNPLFLRTVLEELRVSATHPNLDKRLSIYLGARDNSELFARMLERLEVDCEPGLVGKALTLIWASRAGLEERRIIEIIGTSPLAWSVLYNGLGDNARDQAGRITFSHDFLRDAVKARYLRDSAEEQAVRLKLADYFERQPRDARQSEELPYQLREAQSFARLESVLTDLDRFGVLAGRGHAELLSHWISLLDNGRTFDLLPAAFFSKHGAEPAYDRRVIEEASAISRFLLYAGAPKSALRLEEWALKARSEMLGPHHPDVLAGMNNLAFCYYEIGDTARSEEIEERFVKATTEAFGENDPRSLLGMENLAMSLKSRGEYARARDLFERVANARRLTKGEDAEETLQVQGYLGSTLSALGMQERAEELLASVLKRKQRLLGDDHVQTLMTKAAFAQALEDGGKYNDALPLRREVLASRQSLLGPRHKMTLAAMATLATALFRTGQAAEAQALSRQVIGFLEQYGQDPADTITARLNLAAMLYEAQDYQAARQLEEQVVESSVRLLGPEHPDTLSAMNNLGGTLAKLGEYRAALALKQRAAEKLSGLLGPHHPRTLAARGGIPPVLFELGRREEAKASLLEVVETFRSAIGAEHPDTLSAEENLAVMISKLGEREAAIELQKHVVEVRVRTLGEDHPYTGDGRMVLMMLKAGIGFDTPQGGPTSPLPPVEHSAPAETLPRVRIANNPERIQSQRSSETRQHEGQTTPVTASDGSARHEADMACMAAGMALTKKEEIGHYERAVAFYPGHSHAWCQLGGLYGQEGRYDASKHAFEKALETASDAGEEGVALWGLGLAANDRKEHDLAEEFFTRAATRLEGVADETETLVSCVKNIASLKFHRGASDAERAIQDALALAKTHGLPEHELDCVRWLVGMAKSDGRADDEERLLKEALALETRLDRKKDQARSHHLLRGLAWKRHDEAAAKVHGEQALALFRELEDQEGIAIELYNLGVIARNNDELEHAYRMFSETLSIAEQIDLTRFMIDSLHKLGDLDYRLDRLDDAERWLNRALKLSTETGDGGAQALSLYTLGCVAEDRGDRRRQIAYWTQARPLAEADGNTEMVTTITQFLQGGNR